MATQTVHFRVGEDAGKLIMQIAQAHLLYDYDPNKALTAILDSLSGCPKDLALQILRGDVILNVDVEEQVFLPSSYEKELHEKLFPRPDLLDWSIRKKDCISKSGEDLKTSLQFKMNKMKYGNIQKSFDYSTILKFIQGDDDVILDEFRYDPDIEELSSLVNLVKQYTEKSLKILSVIDWMEKTYPKDFKDYEDDNDTSYILTTVMNIFSDMMKQDYSKLMKEDEALDNFVKSSIENDKVIKNGIQPVNILDNWSAGWLSPEGTYYALNGEIANMLHNQIANALLQNGLIKSENEDDRINPDSWLEQHGWVKIHGNHIQFAGCLNQNFRLKNVDLTPIQIETIYKYIGKCHDGIMKLGWRMEQTSVAKFEMMSKNNLLFLYKTYFTY